MKTKAGGACRARYVAALLVHRVIDQGESLSGQLASRLGCLRDPRDRAFAQELAFGVLRWFYRLDAVLGQLLARPLKHKDHDVRAVMLVGLYQLLILDTPPHAAISETVEAARQTGKTWAVRLVNGVLRNAQRHADTLFASIEDDLVAHWSHPDWWITRLQQDWPAQWQQVLEANNQRPPMVLRVNARKTEPSHYLKLLQDADIEARLLDSADTAIQLGEPVNVERLPGFKTGLVSVQDGAAQLSVPLMQLHGGQRVLDACAAPGGKTGHLLEFATDECLVVAIDNDERRLEKVRENLERLELVAELICADAGATETWWDGRPFDRILLDAPCSASGVVRRHPDIKLLRRASDLPALHAQQQRLLESLWPLLAPGGILLYVTCSVFRQENEGVVGDFLATHKDACELPLVVEWGLPQSIGRQILPGQHGMDGFYFARLIKSSAKLQ